ncbi:MAG: TAXI family TRAP transporter solute-binding subunit [Halalkalicoccus sp.]
MAGGRGLDRRAFLVGAGAGVTGLAGCIGGDEPRPVDEGGDENGGDTPEGAAELRMRTATSTTAAYAANQGIAAAVNENTDEVFVEAQTSPGTEANIGALQSGEAEMVYIQNWSAADVREGVEPFDNLDFSLNQVFHYYDLPWFFCSANEELDSIGDIGAETTVSPTPRGSGTAAALEQALDYAVEEYERVSEDYGEQASAMSEGRLDVGVGTYMNFEIVPGWLQEMMGTVDLRVLEVPEEVVEEWEADERLLAESFPGEELEDAAFAPEEVWNITFAYNFVCRDDLEYDTVYAFLETMYEAREGLSEYHALLTRLEDESFWVENAYEGVPFHPAAADFYEEIGIWNEELERGEG